MIQAGKNITQKDDPLQKIKVEYLYHKIKKPDTEIATKIRQLRIVRQLDPKQYSILKRQLPYIVCGIFNPPYRKTENFGFTEYFMVDIDHIGEKEMDINELREKLKTDNRVVLCFVSPGEDGLKVLFSLNERCYDAGLYSIFYKLFVLKFAKQYSLEQVIDARTSDVSRACFISMDEAAYYNPDAGKVDMNQFMNSENTSELFSLKKRAEKETEVALVQEQKPALQTPDEDTLNQIRTLLQLKSKAPLSKKDAFVPQELNELMEKLIPFIEQTGVCVSGIENINYGKKIKMKTGIKEAEINVFYGKKGYSVVISPRRGTNDELNVLMSQLIEQFLYT